MRSRTIGSAILTVAALVSPGPVRPDSPATTDELRSLLREGGFTEAERQARALLADLEGRGASETVEAAEVLDVLVEALRQSGKAKDPQTLEQAQRAVRIKEQALGQDAEELTPSLDNLGRILVTNGRFAEARHPLSRSLRIREWAFGSASPKVAPSLNLLAWTHYESGEFETARSMYERSIRLVESAPDPDLRDLATALNNLAIVQKTLGDYDEARRMYERALGILEGLPGNDGTVASTLNNLAILLRSQGDYVAALSLYDRALQVGERAWGLDSPRVAPILDNFAALHDRMGDFDSARKLHERALRIFEESVGADHPSVAAVLNNLGALHLESGDTSKAGPLLEKALRIRENARGRDHLLVSRVLTNLGQLQVKLGDLPAAKSYYDRSLAIIEAALGTEHPDAASVHKELGDLLHRQGDHAGARRHLERAREIYERSLGSEHPRVAGVQRALAAILLDAGDSHAAIELALSADAVGREHLRLTARTLSERQALAYAGVRPAGQDLALSALVSRGASDVATAVWDALIRSRALVLDEMRSRHAASSQAEEPARELARASERLANLLVRGEDETDVARYRQLLDGARESLERAERSLAEASREFRHGKEATGRGFAEVALALPTDAALVAYARFQRRRGGASVAWYAAFVVRQGGEAAWTDLGPAEAIDRLVEDWRAEIAKVPGLAPLRRAAAERDYAAVSSELRRAVWDPVAPGVVGARKVFVVPDGPLHVVNLAALAAAAGGYLVESVAPFHYLSAERDLIGEARAPGGAGLLVVGGADFGTNPAAAPPSACSGLESLRFLALPGSLREVEAVAGQWSELGSVGPAASVSRLLGQAATEAAFKTGAPGHRVLHVATHGFFVGDRCAARAPGDAGEEDTIRGLVPRPADDTVVLSGLAFSGANVRRAPTQTGDGILTAQEIAAIDLDGVDWVVLSGCDTGLGVLHAGEGVLGLGRAFRIAGARSLILSLWPVEDASIRPWMRRLYEGRRLGLDSAEAVHHASLDTLEARRRDGQSSHPFHWGAFLAVGR